MTAAQKILDIQQNLHVEKTGYDDRNDYHYFKADDVADAVRGEMNRVGLIHRTVIHDYLEETKWDPQGRGRVRTSFRAEVIFIDPDDNTEFSTEVTATGSDVGGDKSTRKAQVQAFKIAALDLFVITEGSAFDSDGQREQEPMDMTPEAKAETGKADIATLRKEIGKLVNDPEVPIDSPTVNRVGARIAKEAGMSEDNKVWQKDVDIMVALVSALKGGEVE